MPCVGGYILEGGPKMNLNELREAMASDATKENEELKRDLASLEKRYYKDTEHLRSCCNAQLEDMKALANRCWVLSRGELCFFCELNTYRCPHSMNFDGKLRKAKKLRKEAEKQ